MTPISCGVGWWFPGWAALEIRDQEGDTQPVEVMRNGKRKRELRISSLFSGQSPQDEENQNVVKTCFFPKFHPGRITGQ